MTMGQSEGTEPSTTEIFLELLKRASQAHGVHEQETGKADPDWPQWYAEHMTRTLRDFGYRLTRG
jgi:hypothetical protein